MKKLMKMSAMVLVVIMCVMMSTTAFAANEGESRTLDVETPTNSMKLHLHSYIGTTKRFYVMTESKTISPNAKVNLQLYSPNSTLYSEWTVGCNEYGTWEFSLPSSGDWTLIMTAEGLELEKPVTVFARWM